MNNHNAAMFTRFRIWLADQALLMAPSLVSMERYPAVFRQKHNLQNIL